MAHKKYTKEERKMQAAQLAYNKLNEKWKLDDKNIAEQVRFLVDKAIDVQKDINNKSDKIYIDIYLENVKLFPMSKSEWREFVSDAVRIVNGEDMDKRIAKYKKDIYKNAYSALLKKSFLETYILNDDGRSRFPDSENAIDPYTTEDLDVNKNENLKECPQFIDNLRESVQLRSQITERHLIEYNDIAFACYYVTDAFITPKDFKALVEWELTKDGGIPQETSKPKAFAIWEKFNYCARLLEMYEFKNYDKLKNDFGLDVTLKKKSLLQSSFENWKIMKEF